jgi:hypothetical protein
MDIGMSLPPCFAPLDAASRAVPLLLVDRDTLPAVLSRQPARV